ncbi:MAG: hypothetical protein EHM27_00215 [Deltaproteobacteria bacterium]|nr:MAG: hypothetical protein EHM27_00215 [Deltaproteobacteria bacterium]
MSENSNLKTKLGKNVFKPVKEPHIRIRQGFEKDPRLQPAIYVCPAGLYTLNSQGAVQLESDGCLECGACRIVCGTEVLEWNYPVGGTGVQFRFG